MLSPGWDQLGLVGEEDVLGWAGEKVLVVRIVGVPGGCWCELRVLCGVVCAMVVSLSLPVVFCGGPIFPCVRYSCSLGGSGFCVAFVVLVLLRVA